MDTVEVGNATKWAMLGAVFGDGLGERWAHAGQRLECGGISGVNVDWLSEQEVLWAGLGVRCLESVGL
jgi:hypothetical protein